MRDYEHDEWIAWYVEDTAGWLELSLGARGAMAEIARKLNRKGELSLRRGLSSLAVILRVRWEGELEPAIAELIAAGKVTWDGSRFLLSDPEYLARRRKGSADRMREKRTRDSQPPGPAAAPSDGCDASDVTSVTSVTGVTRGHVTDVTAVLVSYSISSDLGSREGVQGEGPPGWFEGVLDTIAMATGETLELGPAWLRYRGHRAKKREPMGVRDAEYWLTTVMVPERKRERDEARRRNERDAERTAAIVRERHGPEVKPMAAYRPPAWEQDAASPEEQVAAGANLQKLLGG